MCLMHSLVDDSRGTEQLIFSLCKAGCRLAFGSVLAVLAVYKGLAVTVDRIESHLQDEIETLDEKS